MYFNVSGAMGDVSRNRVAAFPRRGAAGLRPAESARSSRRPHDVTAGLQTGQEKMRVALLKRETFAQRAQYRLGTLAFVDEPAPRDIARIRGPRIRKELARSTGRRRRRPAGRPARAARTIRPRERRRRAARASASCRSRSTRFAFAACGDVARSHRARRRRSGRPNRRPHRAARARRRAASVRNRRVQPRLPCSVGICSNRLESQSTKSLSLAGTCRFGGYSTEIGRAGVLKPVRTSRNSPDFR